MVAEHPDCATTARSAWRRDPPSWRRPPTLADGEFDLVLNRHGTLDVAETWRALTPGGILLAQQVGCRNDIELNVALGAPSAVHPGVTLEEELATLQAQGFEILEAREEMPDYVFFDIGAIVYQLLAVPWQISDFDVATVQGYVRFMSASARKAALSPVITGS